MEQGTESKGVETIYGLWGKNMLNEGECSRLNKNSLVEKQILIFSVESIIMLYALLFKGTAFALHHLWPHIATGKDQGTDRDW